MKRIFAIALAIILVFSMAACSTPAPEAPTEAQTEANNDTGDNNTGFYDDLGERISASCGGQRAMTIESGTGDSEGRFVLTIWGA